MSSLPVPPFSRRFALAATLGFALSLAACGGGNGDDLALAVKPAQQARGAAAVHVVQVEGCVVDRHHIPNTGTPVRALSADGRLLANALSDRQGRFTLQLPAARPATLAVDRPNGDTLPLQVGTTPAVLNTCLLDEQA